MPGPAKQPNRESDLHRIVQDAPDLAPSTRERYLRDLNGWIDFAGANPSGWTPSQAQAFYSQMLTSMKPQSATRTFASLQYAARWWAISLNRPDLNFTTIRTAKATRPEGGKPLEAADAIRLLDTCDTSPNGVRDYALIVLGLETGMRRMSLSAATIEGLTPTNIRVPIKGSNSELVDIVVTDTAYAALVPWLRLVNAKRGPLFRPIVTGTDAKSGRQKRQIPPRRLSDSAIYSLVRERCRKVGVHGHPHVFRHTFTTWRANQGYQINEIAAVTHHTVNVGAIGIYIDEKVIAEKMRQSTPAFLREHVARRFS